MKFYTLLYIDGNETSTHSNRSSTFEKQIETHINCIRLLKRTLQNENFELELLTNDKKLLLDIMGEQFIEITELLFTMNVPTGVKFYSAHFKIEVYNFLANSSCNYVGLLDNDMVCINKAPKCLYNCIEEQIPLYYDISNQVFPAYGQEKILLDKQKVSIDNRIGIWAGGEFIMGPPNFFKALYEEAMSVSENYFSNVNQLHHQGDEVIGSVALENYIFKKKGIALDAGVLNIVGRYWGYPPMHEQKSFSTFTDCFLLHLPASKKSLSKLSSKNLYRYPLINKIHKDIIYGLPENYAKYLLHNLLNKFKL